MMSWHCRYTLLGKSSHAARHSTTLVPRQSLIGHGSAWYFELYLVPFPKVLYLLVYSAGAFKSFIERVKGL